MTLEQLQAQLAALPKATEIPNTPRAQEAAWQDETQLTRRINLVRSAQNDLAALEPQIADFARQYETLATIRAELTADLLAGPSRSTDRVSMDRIQGLQIGIRCLDGRFDVHNESIPVNSPLLVKLAARNLPPPHQWRAGSAIYGPLPSIEQRMAELQKRRDAARQQLDMALRDPVTV